jgi:hypothetical protein
MTKSRSKTAPTGLTAVLYFLWGPGRPLTLAAVMTATLAAGCYIVWYRVRDRVQASSMYRLHVEQIHITPLPAWIHSDVRSEVFRNGSLDGNVSILDDNLAAQIGGAFALHPWIARVSRVRKLTPAAVDVELVYRQPVCMVATGSESLPVDVDGVLLPSGDFSPVEKGSYPLLVGIDAAPLGPVGQRWGNQPVVGGAEIAEALHPVWQTLRLQHIAPLANPPASAGGAPYYELVTRAGTHITWGIAPYAAAAGEPTPRDKVDRLLQYVADHGSLDSHASGQDLDIAKLPNKSR